ncbi:hypothetical protein [Microbacterium hydrocarbonoxydans]|uniref:hypothetical protein n=1 Tax=Microbacterium hydrocarbonoxydans TaxID=273678 RepID=UPI003D96E535
MTSPTPTPTPGIPEVVLDFLWNHGIGQAILWAAISGIVGFIFRTWIKARLIQLRDWIRDLRWTRRSTIDAEIASAVEATASAWRSRLERAGEAHKAAMDELREELTPSPEPAPAVISEEDMAELRDRAGHEAGVRDRWIIATYRSQEQGYALTNYAARMARDVELSSPVSSAFQFLGPPPPWDQIEQGETVYFRGRIANASYFAAFDRELKVTWTDDHGDQQVSTVQVDHDPLSRISRRSS